MKALVSFNNKLNKVVIFAAMVCFAVMTLLAGLQVFTRYLMNASLEWSEELARFLFIYVSLLGSSILVRNNGHINMDLLLGRLKPSGQRILNIVSTICCIVFFIAMTVYGATSTAVAFEQVSPGANVNMGLVYAAVPISGAIMLLYSIEQLLTFIAQKVKKSGEDSDSISVGGVD